MGCPAAQHLLQIPTGAASAPNNPSIAKGARRPQQGCSHPGATAIQDALSRARQRAIPSPGVIAPVFAFAQRHRTRLVGTGARPNLSGLLWRLRPNKGAAIAGFWGCKSRTKLCLCGAGEQTAPGSTAGHRPRGTGHSVNAHRCSSSAPTARSPPRTPQQPGCGAGTQPPDRSPQTPPPPPEPGCAPDLCTTGAGRSARTLHHVPSPRGPEHRTQLSPIDRDTGRPIDSAQLSGCPADAAQLSSPRTPAGTVQLHPTLTGPGCPADPTLPTATLGHPTGPLYIGSLTQHTLWIPFSPTLEATYRPRISYATLMTPYNPFSVKPNSGSLMDPHPPLELTTDPVPLTPPGTPH